MYECVQRRQKIYFNMYSKLKYVQVEYCMRTYVKIQQLYIPRNYYDFAWPFIHFDFINYKLMEQ